MDNINEIDLAAIDELRSTSDGTMQLYVHCPNETCGCFLKGLEFLALYGIVPALSSDGENHFFEYSFPDGWSVEQKIEFKWDLAHKSTGIIFCRCGQCLKGYSVNTMMYKCDMCGSEFVFCRACDAFEKWAGCNCKADAYSRR